MNASAIKLTILTRLFCLITFINTAPAETFILNSRDTQVTNIMHNLMQKYAIPGAAVLVYENGKMHKYSFGVMNKNKVQVSSKTIFELGSVTKIFTSLLLAEQVISGNSKLGDKLANYLNDNNTISNEMKQINLLELATHTSGLPYNAPNLAYNASLSSQNKQLLNKFLHNWVAPYPAGTAKLYSNFGFALLGIGLANHIGKPLSEAIQQAILIPLRMPNSFFTIPHEASNLYANGYTADGKLSRTPNGGMFAASWAMKSSADDMANYLCAAIGTSETTGNLSAAMKVAQSGYFQTQNGNQLGLGWTIIPLAQANIQDLLKVKPVAPRKKTPTSVIKIQFPQYIANALIEKTGATNGFRSYIGVIPNKKIGVVIMVNKFVYDANAIEQIGRQLIFR